LAKKKLATPYLKNKPGMVITPSYEGGKGKRILMFKGSPDKSVRPPSENQSKKGAEVIVQVVKVLFSKCRS
jgi:hypothetical protein